MATFSPIDINTWARKPYFDHFYNAVKCTYSITVHIDITSLLDTCKKAEIKLYPCLIHIISQAVNEQELLRTNFDLDGRLGVWDVLFPSYTIFHDDDKTFSSLWTVYAHDFSKFHQSFLDDTMRYGESKAFSPKGEDPLNTFHISCIPWIDFTAFNLNIYDDARYLLPIFTIGKYTKEGDKTTIPIACQFHHALTDGYHASMVFTAIKDRAAHFEI